ncbi:MAG: siphovirus Gp157 family protein [bacterium]
MAGKKPQEPTTGLTLAQLSRDRMTLDEWIVENEGEETPELQELLLDNDMAVDRKITAIAYVIDTELARAEAKKAVGTKLVNAAKAIVNRMDWLKNGYLASYMAQLGKKPGDKIEGIEADVRIQLNNPRLDPPMPEADDEVALAAYNDGCERLFRAGNPFAEQVITYKLDRNALLAAAKLDPSILPMGMTIVRDESVRIA